MNDFNKDEIKQIRKIRLAFLCGVAFLVLGSYYRNWPAIASAVLIWIACAIFGILTAFGASLRERKEKLERDEKEFNDQTSAAIAQMTTKVKKITADLSEFSNRKNGT